MSTPAIKVSQLYRYFGAIKAVDGLSFEIPHGSVCGFVGANGAGKTTTMRIMASLDFPTMGSVQICGQDVTAYPEEVRRLIGWMPDHFGNYDHMTVLEYLDFYARALGYKGEERRQRIHDVMDFTDLIPLADRLSNKMSKGMTQRLGLARSLIHDPQIMIMDEPAAGLDPQARVELKHLIRVLAEEGKTVFISSHILSELGEMCDSLLFIDSGRIVHHGTSESLRSAGSASNTSLYDVQLLQNPDELSAWIAINPQVELAEIRKRGARIEINSTDPEVISTVLQRMIKDGLKITEFSREERNLEDAFIDIVGKIRQGNPDPVAPVPTEPQPAQLDA